MKKLNYLLLLLVMCISMTNLNAQKQELPLKVKFGGYVHTLFTYDTRQMVAAREGHILLYPKNESLDAAGKDINEGGVYNMAVIQSRMNAKITGPEIFGAKTNGLIEAEFIGNGESDTNGLRVRHAFVNLDWGNTSLLIGQTWSPLFVAEVFPFTVGANAGLPFKPFARNPQVRLTHKTGNWKLLGAIATERDYTSTGPDGSSNKYLRNAGLPIVQGQIHYYAGEKKHLFGVSGEFKTLKPSLQSSTVDGDGNVKTWKNDETINSWAVMGYFKLNFNPVTFKAQTTYGTNLTDVLMLGGYAAKSLNPATNEASYTGIKVMGSWAELSYKKNNWEYAFLAGYSKDYGADDNVVGNMIYSRGKDVKSGTGIGELYRLAPRVCKKYKNLKFELEAEYTAAAYGKLTEKAKVEDAKWVGGTRFSLGVYYFF